MLLGPLLLKPRVSPETPVWLHCPSFHSVQLQWLNGCQAHVLRFRDCLVLLQNCRSFGKKKRGMGVKPLSAFKDHVLHLLTLVMGTARFPVANRTDTDQRHALHDTGRHLAFMAHHQGSSGGRGRATKHDVKETQKFPRMFMF